MHRGLTETFVITIVKDLTLELAKYRRVLGLSFANQGASVCKIFDGYNIQVTPIGQNAPIISNSGFYDKYMTDNIKIEFVGGTGELIVFIVTEKIQ